MTRRIAFEDGVRGSSALSAGFTGGKAIFFATCGYPASSCFELWQLPACLPGARHFTRSAILRRNSITRWRSSGRHKAPLTKSVEPLRIIVVRCPPSSRDFSRTLRTRRSRSVRRDPQATICPQRFPTLLPSGIHATSRPDWTGPGWVCQP